MQINYFSDSDWTYDRDEKSVASYAIYLGLNFFSWSFKKHTIFSRSGTEAGYRALAHPTSEVMCIQSLLDELHFKLVTLSRVA